MLWDRRRPLHQDLLVPTLMIQMKALALNVVSRLWEWDFAMIRDRPAPNLNSLKVLQVNYTVNIRNLVSSFFFL